MGYQDRDWYRDHHRREDAARAASYSARTFQSRSHAPWATTASGWTPGGATNGSVLAWLLFAAVVFLVSSAVLKARYSPPHSESVLQRGTTVGGLHIVATASSTTSVIDLHQVSEQGVVNGFVWTIVVPARAVQDRLVPTGTYRVMRIRQFAFFGESRPVELPALLAVRPLAEGGLSGTLQLK